MNAAARSSQRRVTHRIRRQVAVVGAGPVGLFLGCCLRRLGISFVLLEREPRRAGHSRAIGIHPPSLELFERLGVVDRFLEAGVQVPGGRAVVDGREVGAVRFESCPGPYRFVLALPQTETERILEETLTAGADASLERGASVVDLSQRADGVDVVARQADGEPLSVDCEYVVGCDGKSSVVRCIAQIPFVGRSYPDAYVMGDFTDNTEFGREAYVFLGAAGLVESFPLPGGLRRWVLKTHRSDPSEPRDPAPDIDSFCDEILARTGCDLRREENFLLNGFGIERYIATAFHRGRIVLAGDAAHVMSPIGGQGMNVGWLDAWDVAATLLGVLEIGRPADRALRSYSRRGRARARRASRRAAFNTALGRGARRPRLRQTLLRCLLSAPVSPLLARLFTMRWLGALPERPRPSQQRAAPCAASS